MFTNWPMRRWLMLLLIGCVSAVCAAEETPTPDKSAGQEKAKPPQEASVQEEDLVAGRFIAQPGLNRLEIEELLEVVQIQVQTRLGYHVGRRAIRFILPDAPHGINSLTTLVQGDSRTTRIVQLGYKIYRTQAPHIYVRGACIDADQKVRLNEDAARMVTIVLQARKAFDDQQATFEPGQLATRRISLSYVDPQRCLKALQLFGYTVGLAAGDQASGRVDPATLPMIVAMPPTASHGLLKSKDETFPLTDADPITELLVFYHPEKPEQFSQVFDRVHRLIDLPARQIMIEAMVLEIAETALNRLGVEWELQSPKGNLAGLKMGRLPSMDMPTSEGIPMVDVELEDVFGELRMQLQALIREGSAEVLSRPSVLTLDNRMAFIDVSQRIPIVNSIQNQNTGATTVSFKEVTAGITLNVRPRISADAREISMQVIAAVTARVPNADVQVTNSEGDVVANAPTISSREVKTYTRIANNTPFIIGGLVARDDTTGNDKVPILGDIPLLSTLFKGSSRSQLKREVIIVITPYVLPETQIIGRNLPKDEDLFDSFGNRLYRDAYRIRSEDVFQLGFLLKNPRLLVLKELVNEQVRRDFRIVDQYPYSQFVGDRIPGERFLVYRQMYEVIKRRGLEKRVRSQNLILFEPNPSEVSGVTVAFLWNLLGEVARLRNQTDDPKKLFETLSGKALAMTYTMSVPDPGGDVGAGVRAIMSQPVPQVRLIDCADRTQWGNLLWEMNQPDREGRSRRTILLHEPRDLVRLKRAVLLKQVVDINATERELTLANFSLGQQLLMPEVPETKNYLLDDQAAAFFFFTEHYYPMLQQELTRDVEAILPLVGNPERVDLPANVESLETGVKESDF